MMIRAFYEGYRRETLGALGFAGRWQRQPSRRWLRAYEAGRAQARKDHELRDAIEHRSEARRTHD